MLADALLDVLFTVGLWASLPLYEGDVSLWKMLLGLGPICLIGATCYLPLLLIMLASIRLGGNPRPALLSLLFVVMIFIIGQLEWQIIPVYWKTRHLAFIEHYYATRDMTEIGLASVLWQGLVGYFVAPIVVLMYKAISALNAAMDKDLRRKPVQFQPETGVR
jgi:hypothetical protein